MKKNAILFHSVKETAELLGVSRTTVMRKIYADEFDAVRLWHRIGITPEVFAKLKAKVRQQRAGI